MFKNFIFLEWRSFFRSASFGQNLAFKILMVFLFVYFAVIFVSAGIGLFFILKKLNLPVLETVNKYLIYYLLFDLFIRYFFQKMPTLTIRPLLVLPISKNKIIHYTLGKGIINYLNTTHAFFFIPFTIVLALNGFSILGILAWHLGIFCTIYINNFCTILINNRDWVFYSIVSVLVAGGLSQYYNWFDITNYTQPIFQSLYNFPLSVFAFLLVLISFYFACYQVFKTDLTLDERLHIKKDLATSENLNWLNKFGKTGTFLKNDIKLLKRNKRAKTTLWMSLLFLFYGLIFFTNNIYKDSIMIAFAAIFVTGGFLINFGQFVPSWDSSYYPLMMTQSISYKQYLESKWWLMAIGTIISMVAASFYLFFGLKTYLLILACGLFNIGFNTLFVLLTGAYTKTAIDLESAKGAFGDKKAFNLKTILFSLPQMLLPMLLFFIGKKLADFILVLH